MCYRVISSQYRHWVSGTADYFYHRSRAHPNVFIDFAEDTVRSPPGERSAGIEFGRFHIKVHPHLPLDPNFTSFSALETGPDCYKSPDSYVLPVA